MLQALQTISQTARGIQGKNVLLALACLFLVSCLGQQKASNTRRKTASSNTTTTTKPAPTSPTQTDNLYWYTNTIIQSDFVTVNQNSQTVIYLRGADINNFLAKTNTFGVSNFTKTYCIVAQYSNTTAKKQLRARAVPIGFNDFVTKTYERLLRIDFPEEAINSTVCDGSVGGYSSTADIAYTLSTFCPTCSSIIASVSFNLYESVGGAINDSATTTTVVNPLDLDVKPLGIRIDTTSGSTSGESTCSNSSCAAKGFDCCLNGQCVDDGALRPGASLLPEYSQAMSDIALNPLRFTEWPRVFYICTNVVNPDPTPVPGTDPNPAANDAFEKLKKEYYCLEEGKKENPDFSVGSCSDSKYLSKLTCEANGKCNSASFSTKATCEAGGKIWTPHVWTYHCFPSGSQTDHNTIRSDVWARCGCAADPFPTEPEEPLCPDYGLRAVTDASGKILEVMCYFPAPETDPQPFQKLEISLSARSAPHRFYLKDVGTAIDDVTTFNFLTLVPELEDALPEFENFYYIDESSKLEPVNNENFNPNAILGQFVIDLSRARPAMKIDVEVDQTYIIMTTKGAYTPCPQCAKDNWFTAFSPFPNSLLGRGLEAIGHTTERDNYSTNITLGNYEDTIFGRACFLPITMVPMSHRPQGSNLLKQRQDRLTAQTAMWVNGYQRDWFGFNHGAVIGSFDGVKWFAVGGGRRVIATTKKLYLAINAPFADLADPTQFTVSITTEDGNNFAADHDFDPELSTIDARNNAGASCQRYHQCDTDSDCVSQLGWEYMCANVGSYKTYVPSFAADGSERNLSVTSTGFSKVLQSGTPPGTNKRCVYRGAGAPCLGNYDDSLTIFGSDSTMDRKRLFMCAPNFTCQPLNQGTFNDQVVREPNNLFNVFYGKDADVLGRPKNYVRGNKTLPPAAKDNIRENISLYHKSYSSGTKFTEAAVGLCRPAKTTGNSSYLTQHQTSDPSLRADFVNQIGSCDPSQTSTNRTRSCPVFDMDRFSDTDETEVNKNYGNYHFPISSGLDDNKQRQNMCGKSAQNSSKESAFASIELTASPSNFLEPALVEHACLRRAGSFCHTDLDCGPNKMHAEVTEQFDLNYFGGTNAEKKYWTEYLVCGQAEPQPFLSSTQFNSYKLTENRCCREIGKELTMYTSLYDNSNFADENADVLDTGDTSALITSKRTSDGPHVNGRYSRYEDVNFTSPTSIANIANSSTDKVIPRVNYTTVPTQSFQWRTFQKTGRNSCCGGGFVRKFADGSHDWSKRDRFKFDPRNFACLNFKTELPLPYFGGHWGEKKEEIFDRLFDDDPSIRAMMEVTWGNDVPSYCTTPQVGNQPDTIDTHGRGVGCANLEIPEVDEDNKYALTPPIDASTSSRLRVQFFPANNYLESGSGSGSGSSSSNPITMRHVFPDAPFFPNEWNYTPSPIGTVTVNGKPDFADNIESSWAGSLIPWALDADGTDDSNLLSSFSFFWPSYLPFPNRDGAAGGHPDNIERATVHFFTDGQSWCDDGSTVNSTPLTYKNGPSTATDSSISGYMQGHSVDLRLPIPSCADIDPIEPFGASDDTDPYTLTGAIGMVGIEDGAGRTRAAWCYINDPSRGMVVVVSLPQYDFDPLSDSCGDADGESFPWRWAGLEVVFNPPNTASYDYSDGNENLSFEGTFPGNALYYLSKLGRMELLGIPQIFNEPIYCNANRDIVLPGLFSDSFESRSDITTGSGFISYSGSVNEADNLMRIYDAGAPIDPSHSSRRGIYFSAHEDKFENEAIFSDNEFLCCAKLGTSTTTIDNCCSGHGIADPNDNTRFVCKLPRGANLNVFFNRFVSSEGLLSDLPEDTEDEDKIGFKDSHFIPETGEIKFSDEAYDTLIALGQQHCESGTVRPGGALGRYFGEPNRGIFFNSDDPDSELQDGADPEAKKFGFADSPRDFDSDSGEFPTGYAVFLAGYRWNHHYYCD